MGMLNIVKIYRNWVRADSPGQKVEVAVDALRLMAEMTDVDWDDEIVDFVQVYLALPFVLDAIGTILERLVTEVKSPGDLPYGQKPKAIPVGLIIQIILALIQWLQSRGKRVPKKLLDRLKKLQDESDES